MNEGYTPWAAPDGETHQVKAHPSGDQTVHEAAVQGGAVQDAAVQEGAGSGDLAANRPQITGHVISISTAQTQADGLAGGSIQANQTSQANQSAQTNQAAPNQANQATQANSAASTPNSAFAPGFAPSGNQSQPGAGIWNRPGVGGFNSGAQPVNRLQSSATWASNPPAQAQRGPGWLGAIIIALLMSLLVSGGTYLAVSSRENSAELTSSTLFNPEDKGVATPEPVQGSTSQNPDWQAVAKAVRPAVVAISVQSRTAGEQGSGSIIDSVGHILTNNHVVASAAGGNANITVELHDGRLYTAEIVGRDVITDLAVIKLIDPPDDLTAVALGDSDKLEVGQAVAAIGNPLGLSSTVTTGIVSALNRPVRVEAVSGQTQEPMESSDMDELLRRFGLGGSRGHSSKEPDSGNSAPPITEVTTNAIQVDAAVNPGNSGGPLFDAKGRIIGVNSSIASLSSGSGTGQGGSSGSIGLGFAIPINQASMIATQLIEHGEAVHAALGVSVNEEIAQVGAISRLGAQVVKVAEGSAAKKAGIKEGDIIVGIDGNQVKGASSLVGWVRQHSVGDKVELNLVRNGKEKMLRVTLQAQ